ncbi:hypothetical protein ACPV4A_11480 [Vibrio rotiferianus]
MAYPDKFSIKSKAAASNNEQTLEFTKLLLDEFSINDTYRTKMADKLVAEFIAAPFDFEKQKPKQVLKGIRNTVAVFEDDKLISYAEGRLEHAQTVVGLHLERVCIYEYINEHIVEKRIAKLKVNAGNTEFLNHYLQTSIQEGINAYNIIEVETNFKTIQTYIGKSFPAVDEELNKALQGLTETELQIIYSCLIQKNSHNSDLDKLPIGQVSLKYFTPLLASEICLFGNSTISNTFGSHQSYFKIRNRIAKELGLDDRDAAERSLFLLNFEQHKKVKKRHQFAKGVISLGFTSTEPAFVLLSHIVPIVERSYRFSSTDPSKLHHIIKNSKGEDIDRILERILPYVGEIAFHTDTSFEIRSKFNKHYEHPVFKEGDGLGGLREIESLWAMAIKHPNPEYSDIAASILGIKVGEEAAEDAVINIETLREAKETIRAQMMGELAGNRKKGDVGAEFYKGDIFERLNVIFFNKNAKLQGKDHRAFTTDDLGLTNHQRIDLVVLSAKDKAKFDSLPSKQEKENFIELYTQFNGENGTEHARWQAKCNDDVSRNIKSLSNYPDVGFLGNFSKAEVAEALGKKKISDREFQAFIDNYDDTIKAYGIKGDKVTLQEAIDIASSPADKLSDKAQAALEKHINDQIDNLGKEVIKVSIQAAIAGGVVSAFMEALAVRREGIPLREAKMRIVKAGLKGGATSAIKAALITYATAHAKRIAAQKAMSDAAAKALGKAAGIAVVFVIENAWDLYKFQNGKLEGKELAKNMGNSTLSLITTFAIIGAAGTGGASIAVGVVAGGIIQLINPTARFLLTDYESVVDQDPMRKTREVAIA